MSDFLYYLSLGWHHIISPDSLDHILFIVALTVRYNINRWRGLLTVITAFTVGHSITLALSAFNLLKINQRLVEVIIPFTIVMTAFANFIFNEYSNKYKRVNYLTALFFGLIHGMGFASAIRFSLYAEQSIVLPLFGFNAGLEIGQIFLVFCMLLFGMLLNKISFFKQEWYVWTMSILAMLIGFRMIVERI
jgi:hypothetical protein